MAEAVRRGWRNRAMAQARGQLSAGKPQDQCLQVSPHSQPVYKRSRKRHVPKISRIEYSLETPDAGSMDTMLKEFSLHSPQKANWP